MSSDRSSPRLTICTSVLAPPARAVGATGITLPGNLLPVNLVDREVELAELRRMASSAPRLVIIRGRRRVGKSYLVAEAVGDEAIIYQADEQPETEQLAGFARQASELIRGAPGLRFGSWDDALTFLGAQAASRPVTVVLDEFQYMCAASPGLPSIVQRHWDRWQREHVRITLLLVGSALTFMETLLDQGSPLHGRADYRPLLEPFDYRDAAAFAPAPMGPEERIRRYAVLGGTAQYQVWAEGRDAEAAVRDLMLRPGSPLHDEPLQLLRAEEDIRDTARYFGVLVAIAGGHNRTSDIAGVTGLDASNVSKALRFLEVLGYVDQISPMSPRERSARAIWRLRDPFFRFWFRRIYPNRSRLSAGRLDAVFAEARQDLDAYVGGVFEDCCRDWFVRHSDLPAATATVNCGRWWSRDGQREVDVAALDKRGRYTLLGSCKWQRRPVGTNDLDQLLDHRTALGQPAAGAQLAMFARRRFSDALTRRAEREGVLLASAADLF